MTIQLELNPDITARLAAGAQSRGVPVEQYAESLLRNAMAVSETTGQLSQQELHEMLNAFGQGSENVPQLPTTAFTRASFYEDRR